MKLFLWSHLHVIYTKCKLAVIGSGIWGVLIENVINIIND